jgi:hypothetical protein
MKHTVLWTVSLLIALFAGCSNNKTDQINLRVAALSYAFEHDEGTKTDAKTWVFEITSDFQEAEVIQALSKYPLARGALKIEDRGDLARVDTLSGNKYAHWRVKFLKFEDGEAFVDVGCVKGGLNGYGQILIMKKKWGRWVVVSSTPSWVS